MLELLAMVTMLIDHIGVIFFPEEPLFRIIGRISFPLYIYLVIQGYTRTRNIKNYLIRLLVLAVISQFPYYMAFENKNFNVIFTLLTIVIILWALDHIKENKLLILIVMISLLLIFFMDYGVYGIGLALIYRYIKSNLILAIHLVFTVLYVYLAPSWILQIFSVVGTLILIKQSELLFLEVNRKIYRSFYPVHLTLLYMIFIMV